MIVYSRTIAFAPIPFEEFPMTNGGGPGHHAKAKKKPTAGKASKATTGKKWVPAKLKAAAKRSTNATTPGA